MYNASILIRVNKAQSLDVWDEIPHWIQLLKDKITTFYDTAIENNELTWAQVI